MFSKCLSAKIFLLTNKKKKDQKYLEKLHIHALFELGKVFCSTSECNTFPDNTKSFIIG